MAEIHTPDLANAPDHGGGIDAAAARFGGARAEWLDLSTGINPDPYPLPAIPAEAWATLPDQAALDRLLTAARRFWQVPDGAAVLAANGASALIAAIPRLATPDRVRIARATYNEHARAFAAAGWQVVDDGPAMARVEVHPNNPTGGLWDGRDPAPLTVIDESFADVLPEASLIAHATRPGTLILKSFGKFWGLAGLRLGFAIGDPALIAHLAPLLGPWSVSGPALAVGARALSDLDWATNTRQRLNADATRLDALMTGAGAMVVGGTSLFRLYQVENAGYWQDTLARHRIWTRTFPYAPQWLRLGLPSDKGWPRLTTALADLTEKMT